MMQLILGFSCLFYLLMAQRLFKVWLAIFKKDTSVTPSQKRGAIMIIVIITILWPIVVPFTYLELLAKKAVESESESESESYFITSDQSLRATESSAVFSDDIIPAFEDSKTLEHHKN